MFSTGFFFKGKFKVKIVSLFVFCLRVINLKSENTSYVCVWSGSGKHSRFVCLDFFVLLAAASQTTYFIFRVRFHLVGSLVFVCCNLLLSKFKILCFSVVFCLPTTLVCVCFCVKSCFA